MTLKHLSDLDLWKSAEAASLKEKEATLHLLEHLVEIESRRLYAKRGYSSLFEYVHRGLGYSESQSSERVNAARLLRSVPEVKKKLESGSLSLTTASQVQRFLRSEKKEAGNVFSSAQKLDLIQQCESQSKRSVEKILLSQSAAPAPIAVESSRLITPELTELRFAVSNQAMEKIQAIRNLKGVELSLNEIFEKALGIYLEDLQKKKYGKRTFEQEHVAGNVQSVQDLARLRDLSQEQQQKEQFKKSPKVGPQNQQPTKKSAFPVKWVSKSSRYIPTQVRAQTLQRSKDQCEFIDPLTGKRCESRYCLQFEHRNPRALGGGSNQENILHYCPAHNQLAAIKTFGFGKMREYVPELG